jgi:2-polyprenyl-6-methoxyphenol hydroxylase-like FAD-dependent oxidoreductase
MARILISGGSLGGLMAGNILLRAGHDVLVLERSTRSLEGRGAGIVTHEILRAALRQCGAVVDHTLGVPVESRVVLDARGHAECCWVHPQVLTSWGRLYSLLRAALPAERYRLGAQVAGIEQNEAGVVVRLASGEMVSGELLIACDGIRSSVRAQFAPKVLPQYANYIAWRGVCDEASLSRHTRDTLFGHFGFGLPDGEQMIGYPVAGADDSIEPGQRRWNFVWYRPAAPGAELAALMSDADGVHHPEGIAPQQVSWRHVAAMRQAARDRLAPQFAEIAEKTAVPFLQPIYDVISDELAFGRVALLGDAAFVARPHVGMGVAKAGDDAVVLAACIAELGATPQALRRYAAMRQPVCASVAQRARRLGAYLEARQRGASALRNPVEVMHQTAIDPNLFGNENPATQAA